MVYTSRFVMAGHSMSRRIPSDFNRGELRPPARWELLREARVVSEFLSAWARSPRLVRSVPHGRGETVMVVPGFASGDASTARLRGFLKSIGYGAFGWGLGRNNGNVPRLIPDVMAQTERLAAKHGAPVRLVGWSLGGYLVREVARERPELVDRVITLGAPIVGGPSYTATAAMYVRKGYDLEGIKATVLERERRPITVPIFVVYSRSDGIVAWRACIDTYRNPRVEHHEVSSTHLGLVRSPRVLRLVADLLARSTGGTGSRA